MSLLDITKLPTAQNSAIQLHPTDNIAVARVPLSPGQVLDIGGLAVTLREPVPAGHKVAVRDIALGDAIVRYGQVMGRASASIASGQHVHVHNVAYEELVFNYEYPTGDIALPVTPADAPTFLGYQREDGRVGTRNYIAVVAASNCAAHTVQWIAESYDPSALPENVHGIVAFPHGEGCGHAIGPDTDQLRRTLAGVLAHPNVSAAIIVGLGCETNQITHYLGENAPKSGRLVGMTVQDSGGTRGTVEAARKEIDRFIQLAAEERRTEVSASHIRLGLNCGGSDSFSGITANP
ncbi:MAG: UxaA family hydrolase, partial [Bryobacteraceae bacterium]|nr:UxaA family hydrolase [Bryobacteraceae bacterium]